MKQIIFHIRQRWPLLLNIALLCLFCWLLAQWTWLWVLPQGQKHDEAGAFLPGRSYAEKITGMHFFGRAPEGFPIPESSSASGLSATNIKLQGVFAAIGSLPGFAVLSVDGKPPQPFQEGQEILAGLILDEVHSDHVLLKRGGATARVELEKDITPVTGVTVPEFKLNVQAKGGNSYIFSRAELNQALQDGKQLVNLGRLTPYPAGGMLVEEAPPGSLAGKLGLQVGDVVQRLNFQPVRNQEDVARFLKQLEHTSQARLEGIRAGRSLQLKYEIQ